MPSKTSRNEENFSHQQAQIPTPQQMQSREVSLAPSNKLKYYNIANKKTTLKA
jgi:hypothetical protein